MAKGAKLIATSSKHYTKEEIELRQKAESLGGKFSGEVPESLTNDQKEIYKTISGNLAECDILTNLDTEVLINAAIIIDRLHKIDERIDREPGLYLMDKETSLLRARYFQQFLGITKELCLSPAARAKMGAMMLEKKKKEKDELMDALAGDSE